VANLRLAQRLLSEKPADEMIRRAVRENCVHNHTIPGNFVKNRERMTRHFQPMKRFHKGWRQSRKLTEEFKHVIEFMGENLTSASPLFLVARINRNRFRFRSYQQDYLCHALSASFRLTSSHGTTWLESRR